MQLLWKKNTDPRVLIPLSTLPAAIGMRRSYQVNHLDKRTIRLLLKQHVVWTKITTFLRSVFLDKVRTRKWYGATNIRISWNCDIYLQWRSVEVICFCTELLRGWTIFHGYSIQQWCQVWCGYGLFQAPIVQSHLSYLPDDCDSENCVSSSFHVHFTVLDFATAQTQKSSYGASFTVTIGFVWLWDNVWYWSRSSTAKRVSPWRNFFPGLWPSREESVYNTFSIGS